MGEIFNNLLRSDESLFLNAEFLDFDYQPKIVKFRENQQNYIATCIKPLLQRRNGKNLIILGKPGIGKTVCLKHVLNELKEDFNNEIFCLYINCWKKDTAFKIVSEICIQLNYKWIHNKNVDELLKEAAELINEKSAVIVLDEADKLQDQNIIYSLLEELQRKCLILITNDTGFLIGLDNRIRSRLLPDVLEFKPYNSHETQEILKQRIEYAFVKDVLEKEAFEVIIKKTLEIQDIRAGLSLLKQAGEYAENKSSKKIKVEHAKEAIASLVIEDLDDTQETLIDLLKENSGKSKTEIFKIYEKKEGKSYRTFQRKISLLEKNKKVFAKEEEGDSGKHTILEYMD